jgi:hypothetical protein
MVWPSNGRRKTVAIVALLLGVVKAKVLATVYERTRRLSTAERPVRIGNSQAAML